MAHSRRFWIVTTVTYLALVGGGMWGLLHAKSWAETTLGSQAERENWGEWQEDTQARQNAQQILSERRGHTSAEPPLLILLRDNFAAIVATCLILGTFLFAFFVFVLRGASRPNDLPK